MHINKILIENIQHPNANNNTGVTNNNLPVKESKGGFAFLKNKKNNQILEESNLKSKQEDTVKKTGIRIPFLLFIYKFNII